jgi:hypothetical protein
MMRQLKQYLPLLFLLLSVKHGDAQSAASSWQDRVQVLKQSIAQHFIDPATGYYIEKTIRKSEDKPYAYLWPLCGLVQAANEEEALTGKTGYLDRVMMAIQAYYDPSAPAPAYGSYIVKEKRDDRFYDDNQWIAIACLDAYERTKDKKYLEQGELVYRFMMTGFDTIGGGGLYWKEKDLTTKNTCSNGPGVLVSLQLYKATGIKTYLDTAILLYDWTRKHLLSSENVYYDNMKLPSREIDQRTYTYNTGTMLQSSVKLYEITGEKGYLEHARNLAVGSLKKFFRNGRFPGHYWFNVVLFRGYIALRKWDPDSKYINAMKQDAQAIWEKEKDKNNLVGKKENKELLDQAAVMEIFARLAMLENNASSPTK